MQRGEQPAPQSRIPRTIWALWLQGWSGAPEIVQACRRTWEALNPGWTVRALTAESLATALDEATIASISGAGDVPPEALSDIVRIELLRRYGGVWVDSTTYCLQPLDDWLPHVTAGGFFAFAKPGADRMVSSWFLAAAPHSVVVERWAARTRDYWRGHQVPDEYFWFHYLFADCYHADAEFRAAWDATPEVLARGPHHFEPYHRKLWGPAGAADRELVERPALPLLKLTHKLPPGDYPGGSVIRFLCERAARAGLVGDAGR